MKVRYTEKERTIICLLSDKTVWYRIIGERFVNDEYTTDYIQYLPYKE